MVCSRVRDCVIVNAHIVKMIWFPFTSKHDKINSHSTHCVQWAFVCLKRKFTSGNQNNGDTREFVAYFLFESSPWFGSIYSETLQQRSHWFYQIELLAVRLQCSVSNSGRYFLQANFIEIPFRILFASILSITALLTFKFTVIDSDIRLSSWVLFFIHFYFYCFYCRQRCKM